MSRRRSSFSGESPRPIPSDEMAHLTNIATKQLGRYKTYLTQAGLGNMKADAFFAYVVSVQIVSRFIRGLALRGIHDLALNNTFLGRASGEVPSAPSNRCLFVNPANSGEFVYRDSEHKVAILSTEMIPSTSAGDSGTWNSFEESGSSGPNEMLRGSLTPAQKRVLKKCKGFRVIFSWPSESAHVQDVISKTLAAVYSAL